MNFSAIIMLMNQDTVKHEVNIFVELKFRTSIKKTWLKKVAAEILRELSLSTPSEIGIVVTNDKAIQRLNKAYRNKDGPTDVLSFYMVPEDVNSKQKQQFIAAPDGFSHLGEVVISYPRAELQAAERGHDVKHEIMLLSVHGVLHLLGYDHEKSAAEAKRMKAKETMILSTLVSQFD